MRRSRMPELVAVDLRAQIAGCRWRSSAWTELLERYGAAHIKGVMRKIQDDSEAAFARRLATVPDGEWRERGLPRDGRRPATAALYRNVMVLRKKNDRLEFCNEGTDPQIGTLSCTLPAWSGAVAAMINSQLLFDQLFAIGGAQRRIDFKAEPGTLTSALHPAALSLAVLTLDQCIALAAACHLEDAQLLQRSGTAQGDPVVDGVGGLPDRRHLRRRRQVPAIRKPADGPGRGGHGRWSWRDGLDVGGWPWDPQVEMPNVEETESFYPVLYLWRRVTQDSGGAGKYRGRQLDGGRRHAARCPLDPAPHRLVRAPRGAAVTAVRWLPEQRQPLPHDAVHQRQEPPGARRHADPRQRHL